MRKCFPRASSINSRDTFPRVWSSRPPMTPSSRKSWNPRFKAAAALDDCSELEIVSREPVFIPERYAYFSLLNISGLAQGITIRNAKYPLTDAEITCEYQYGVSNEVLTGMTAEVTVKNGRLLLIKVLPDRAVE